MTTPTETPPTDMIRDAFDKARLDDLYAALEVHGWLTADDAKEALAEIERAWGEIEQLQRAAEEHARRSESSPASHTDDPPLTEEELRAAGERCDLATKGPWAHLIRQEKGQHPEDDDTAHVVRAEDGPITECLTAETAAFIAAARTDLPRALREIRRLRARLSHAHDAANKLSRAAQTLWIVWNDTSVSAEAMSAAIEALAAAIDPAEVEACAREAARRDGLEAEIKDLRRTINEEIEFTHDQAIKIDAQRAEIERLKGLVDGLDAKLAERTAEREEARNWVRRLTREQRVLTCAFCGAEYPPGTPASNDDALTAHVRACPKHPMRESEREIRRLTGELAAIRAQPKDPHIALAPPSDPLAGLPAEERDRILGMGTDAAIEAIDAGKSNAEAIAARDAVRRREVAAYHARTDVPQLTPAEEAEIIASAPGQIGPGQTPIGRPVNASLESIRTLFINLLEIDARARCLCEDASIDHTTTPPSATVEVDQLEALDAALNAVDPSEEYDPAMRDALLAQLDAALSRGAAPAARSTASTELLVRQAAAILSEDEHAEEDTRAGIEQLNQEIKP
jgi:hypothetical protein